MDKRNAATLLPILQWCLLPGKEVHTDVWAAYRRLATTSCKNVETLPRKNDPSCFKWLLVTGLWDIILTSLLPPIQSCSPKFWAWSCIASIFDKGWRGASQGQDHGQAIYTNAKCGTVSQVLLQLVVATLSSSCSCTKFLRPPYWCAYTRSRISLASAEAGAKKAERHKKRRLTVVISWRGEVSSMERRKLLCYHAKFLAQIASSVWSWYSSLVIWKKSYKVIVEFSFYMVITNWYISLAN